MTVYELSQEEMEELKVNHLYTVMERRGEWPSATEIANARDTFSDEEMYEEYGDVSFTEDDFFCDDDDYYLIEK